MRFRPLPGPEDEELVRIGKRIARGLARLLERRGLGPEADPDAADPLSRDDPLLAALYAASVRNRVALGPRAGQPVLRFGDRIEVEQLDPSDHPSGCVGVAGLSLHANLAVPARDRARLERLCRYVCRPPLATRRLTRLDDGRLLYQLRHRWRDGTTHVLFEPRELVEKLAALVPPPRFNLVRYHGVLAPAAARRAEILPPPAEPRADSSHSGCLAATAPNEETGKADEGDAVDPSP